MDQPTSRRGRFDGRVLENRPICVDHYLLRIGLGTFPPTRPGQFINIRCGDDSVVPSGSILEWRAAPPGRGWLEDFPREGDVIHQPELAGRQPLLRRPISLAGRVDHTDGTVELEIIYHVIGMGTAWLAELPAGAPLDVLGPLGNGFWCSGDSVQGLAPPPSSHIAARDEDPEEVAAPHGVPRKPLAALVGGGVGIPPLLYLAETLTAAGVETIAFVGARSRAMLPLTIDEAEPPSQAGWPALCTAEFAARGTATVVATDDGSLGVTGFVHEPFARWLQQAANPRSDAASAPRRAIRNPARQFITEVTEDTEKSRLNQSSVNSVAKDPKFEIRNRKSVAVYACGPEPMMRAVAEVCAAAGTPCQLALERHMACGMGTCQSCVVKVRSETPPGWAYKLACKDGPVFPADELLWE